LIFVTVGTQLPFERLVRAADIWAAEHSEEVFIQTGETVYLPAHCRFQAHVNPPEWEALFQQARLVVSHAGMGTILKSLDCAKPLIVMPRQAKLNEHRNDHQLATASQFGHIASICVVHDDMALQKALSEPFEAQLNVIEANQNLVQLVHALKTFIRENV
jgi:UDP-N-acetylglucosamine transferase subunit ALG13